MQSAGTAGRPDDRGPRSMPCRDALPGLRPGPSGTLGPVDGDGSRHACRAGHGRAVLYVERGPPVTGWLLRYDGWDPSAESLRETLCALGNGRFVTRAAAPERRAANYSYPGTYAAGVFDRLTDEVDGHRIPNESIVNLPDWQSLTFRLDDGPWLDLSALQVTDYVQELDLCRGVLTRRFRIEDGDGRRTRVAQQRLVSMADPCLAAMECTLLAENWTGALTVRSGLDGRVTNDGVSRYRGLDGRHLTSVETGLCDDLLTLAAQTRQSRIRIGMAARQRVLDGGTVLPVVAVPAGDDR